MNVHVFLVMDNEISIKKINKLKELSDSIESGEHFFSEKISDDQRALVDSTFLIAKSPIMLIINSDENNQIDQVDIDKAKSLLNQNTKVLQIPLKFEEDLLEIKEEEAKEFRNELQIENNINK